jgi:hypothetical protein
VRKQRTKTRRMGNRPKKEEPQGQNGVPTSAPLVLDREELLAMMQECLTHFATEVGLKVASLLFEEQVDIRGMRRALPRKRGKDAAAMHCPPHP